MRADVRLLPTLLITMALGLAAAAGALAGTETVVDGVPHVRNGAEPANGTRTLELEELWRAGGEDDEETFFGLISQVLIDADGNYYLLDTQLSEVQVYSPDGENIKTLSREGEGPGEVRNPSDMLFMPDGGIGLVQTFPGKIVRIDLDGNPAGTFVPGSNDPTAGGFAVVIDAQGNETGLFIGGMLITIDQTAGEQVRMNYVAKYDAATGTELVRFLEKPNVFKFQAPELIERDQYFVHFRHWSVGPDGRIYAAPYRNEYKLEVYAPDGTLERVIEREYESWTRDEDTLARVQSALDAQSAQFPGEVKTEVEPTEPDITGLRVAEDGRLWVHASRGGREEPDGILVTYDVFDAAGHFDERIAVVCEGEGDEDILFTRGDRALQVTGFFDAIFALQGGTGGEEDEEAAPMEVVCYRIK